MKGSAFVFNYLYLIYYKCHKINPNCDGSYLDPPDWIKKQTSSNRKGKKCFQYTVTVALNYRK